MYNVLHAPRQNQVYHRDPPNGEYSVKLLCAPHPLNRSLAYPLGYLPLFKVAQDIFVRPRPLF